MSLYLAINSRILKDSTLKHTQTKQVKHTGKPKEQVTDFLLLLHIYAVEKKELKFMKHSQENELFSIAI